MGRYQSISKISAQLVREIQCAFKGVPELVLVPIGEENQTGKEQSLGNIRRAPRADGK